MSKYVKLIKDIAASSGIEYFIGDREVDEELFSCVCNLMPKNPQITFKVVQDYTDCKEYKIVELHFSEKDLPYETVVKK